MKTDKLDRCRTNQTAILTQQMDIPFWCTLTPREMKSSSRHVWFKTHGMQRKQFRDFIRALCA